MRIKEIQFKLTTNNILKCHRCKKKLIGEEGFIHIKCERDSGYYDGTNNMRICWNCIINLLKDCKEDRKDRKEKYLKLTKEAIIRRLK